ncbi:acyl-ACP desaturase [Nocardia asteroides NBRC 15531]|uniref:Acyl-[acyl-carrier-protein] desaturase DesA n=1 Tax=Nocardia asteroides NBRC 15531 TaxID=1110697 RepID=U5EGR4_NOCAS|nr:acyl-ACP desaturase [Nocardia asteroides]TLF67606.1 acyl-ACP desaturase [Nocardia asteroides NBRC 15531]UGT50892.1 acyl-ACP desaturase [Nocardia asteroides]SFN45960.1 Fatty acid desaturase [Nocardia asteroides]VEG36255.1 Putative acyl-[acyl-carrier-protein] desaturase desA2 [Nocardia asteroides]GAD85581.1 acyl-[acyl-carrier-protein] desaturase DesA [Nocardia asteroides NBRC 15531]
MIGTAGLLPVPELVTAVDSFLAASPATRAWDVETAVDWAAADAGRLTEGQRSAVQFVTLIEDHLPGYFDVYHRHFPVDDTVDLPTFEHNRELYHFTVRWALEEDTHARALARYQEAAGMAQRSTLRSELAVEGHKPFDLPYDHPVQFFAYALVQEKATQMYYQQLRDVVADPVLAGVLTRLSRDEARHFSFMADVVTRYLRHDGDAVVTPIRDVVAHFRMPLSDTLRGYWRWALKIADVADYDHTAAYEHLVKVIDRAVDARTEPVDELVAFVESCRALA